jgi:DNA invertase Pin-like site-specific DNA recombinase
VSRLLGQDPKLQLINIREFAAARGYDLIAEYVDEGISGTTERRHGLDQLLADARRGKFQVVITVALDRISRSTKHFLTLFEELQHYGGIAIISLRENLDFSSPTGKMVATILSSIAALERQMIAERIRTSLAAKKLAAEQTGSGWRCGRPTVVTPELIERVMDLHGRGLSIRRIEAAIQKQAGRSTIERIIRSRRKGVPKP